MTDTLLRTDLDLPLFISGKVRDSYRLDSDHLLMIATDRISAFDVILNSGIPYKGEVLNQLSAFWFTKTQHILPNHVVEVINSPQDLIKFLPPGVRLQLPGYIGGRSMVVRYARKIPVECVVRGYLAGSAWAEYRESGTVCGKPLRPGLVEGAVLPEPVFTPTTKADTGHDEPLSTEELKRAIGKDLAREIEEASLALYKFAQGYALSRGFIIADTKFEFGMVGDKLILIDELLTPDSSRFWDVEHYQPGRPQEGFDKQLVRNWLEKSGWNKKPPGPSLPDDIVFQTSYRYREVFRRLTGKDITQAS